MISLLLLKAASLERVPNMAFISLGFRVASRAASSFSGKAYRNRSTRPEIYAVAQRRLIIGDPAVFAANARAELAGKTALVNARLLQIQKDQEIITRRKAREICPVLTGALRASLKINKDRALSFNIDSRMIGILGQITVEYNLYNVSVDSPLPYWPIENNKNFINDIAVEDGIESVHKGLDALFQLGTGLYTGISIRSI